MLSHAFIYGGSYHCNYLTTLLFESKFCGVPRRLVLIRGLVSTVVIRGKKKLHGSEMVQA
jgi:hypothetical protein